jgi:hypothetical protein
MPQKGGVVTSCPRREGKLPHVQFAPYPCRALVATMLIQHDHTANCARQAQACARATPNTYTKLMFLCRFTQRVWHRAEHWAALCNWPLTERKLSDDSQKLGAGFLLLLKSCVLAV